MFSAVAERGSGRLEAAAEDGGIREMRVGGEQQVVNSTRVAARRMCAETAPQTMRTYRIENNSVPAQRTATTFAAKSFTLAKFAIRRLAAVGKKCQ